MFLKILSAYTTTLFFSVILFSQNVSKILGLKKELAIANNDSDRVDALAELCFNYSILNTDTALFFGEQALQLAKKINYIQGTGDSYNDLGWTYFKRSNMPKAEEYFKTALALFEKTGRKDLIEMPIANLGTLYMDQTEYAKSLKCFMQVVKLDDEIIDNGNTNITKNKVSTLHEIGRLYNLQKDSKEARKYFEQALQISLSINSNEDIGENLMSIGNTYQIEDNHQKALNYYYECLKYIKKTNDLYRTGLTYENMGISYLSQHQYDKTIKCFRLAKDDYNSLKSNEDLFYINLDLAQVYDTLNNNVQTLASLNEASQYAKQLNNKNFQQQVFSNLSGFYKKYADYEKAYVYLDSANDIKDSLFTLKKQTELIKLQTQFETEQKEKQITLLKKNQQLNKLSLQKQKILQYALYIILFLLILIGFLVINRYRSVQRAKRLIEMEKIRNDIARNLHDDIGSTLTSINILSKVALLQTENAVTKNNLQKIKNRSSEIMESMSDIVWAINPANDSMDKIILRMREFATETLEQAGMQFNFNEEGVFNDIKLTAAQRNNLYLIFKEAINNAVKYSSAKTISILIKKEAERLSLKISDDGKGFDAQQNFSGNGLKNMQSRAAEMNAKIQFQSIKEQGTSISLLVPVT